MRFSPQPRGAGSVIGERHLVPLSVGDIGGGIPWMAMAVVADEGPDRRTLFAGRRFQYRRRAPNPGILILNHVYSDGSCCALHPPADPCGRGRGGAFRD